MVIRITDASREDVAVDLAADEELRQRKRLILFVVEPEVTVAGPQTSDRDDPLSGDGVAGDVDDVEPDEGQLREADLQLEGLLPDGVEGVARGHLGFVLAAVSGKTNHLKSALFEYFFLYQEIIL